MLYTLYQEKKLHNEVNDLMIQTLLKQSCLLRKHLSYHDIIYFVLISHLNRSKEPYTMIMEIFSCVINIKHQSLSDEAKALQE